GTWSYPGQRGNAQSRRCARQRRLVQVLNAAAADRIAPSCQSYLGALGSARAGITRDAGPGNSVQAGTTRGVTRQAAQMALHRGGTLALALLGRLFVELALTRLGHDP